MCVLHISPPQYDQEDKYDKEGYGHYGGYHQQDGGYDHHNYDKHGELSRGVSTWGEAGDLYCSWAGFVSFFSLGP